MRTSSGARIKPMMLKELLEIFVCPVPGCRKSLVLAEDGNSLRCTGCGRVYPVRDGIPVLRADQAEASK